MSYFPLSVKSTLDKILFDKATENGYGYFDLDGVYMVADKAESVEAAFAMSSFSMVGMPRDPFYQIQFDVDARTADDEAQYLSLQMTSILQELLAVGSSFYVMDYTGNEVPTQNLGEIIISSSGSYAPAFDRVSGLRPVQIIGTVQRFP
jgi:hypothetical protein